MKFKARIDQLGELRLSGEGFGDIGEVELDVKPVKKWVTKEANFFECPGLYDRYCTCHVPTNARNIKITYEVEE